MLTSCSLNLKAEDALQKFLQSKEDVTEAILQTDQALTEKEKETEGEAQIKGLYAMQSSGMFKLLVNLEP